MKKVLLGAIALIALGAKAGAADLRLKAPPPYAPYDWTGFYIGAHAGWESADTSGFTNNLDSLNPNGAGGLVLYDSATDQTMHGWLGGGQVGYNHQFGRAVVGIEFSGSWSNLNSQSAGTVNGQIVSVLPSPPVSTFGTPLACSQGVNVIPGPPGFATTSLSCNAKVDWTGQALTRLGYTFGDGRFLPYIEGGVAVTHLTTANSILFSIPGSVFVEETDAFGKSSELVGVVLGGGTQYALGNGFSIGVEYLYAKYPTQDFSNMGAYSCVSVPTGICPSPLSFTHIVQETHDLTTNTVRAVLNYKFAN